MTAELALAWATKIGPGAHPSYLAKRLSVVRGFAVHLQAFDPATEVPSSDLLPNRACRAVPYLYSDEDITGLMRAARTLSPALRADTYETLIGLLAVTGARIGEIIRLDRNDVDWDAGVLVITYSKFNKSREVPVHPTTLAALKAYSRQAGRGVRRAEGLKFVRVHQGNSPSEGHCPTGLPRPRAGRRARSPLRAVPPPHPRHAPCLRLCHPRQLVPRGSRCRGANAPAVDLFRACQPVQYLLVFVGRAGAAGPRGVSARAGKEPVMSALAPTLEAYFSERLIGQRQASPNTVASYRDAWRLLLRFAMAKTGKEPSKLDIADLDATLISGFLEHLECDRHNGARTRNARLAAVRSFFRYAALRHPEHAGLIARVLDIPSKRCDRKIVTYLEPPEVEALLSAPDRDSWWGRRDQTMLQVAVVTGLRVSELTSLRNQDVELGTGAHVRCRGKGRKERCTPIDKQTVSSVRAWMRERGGQPQEPLFPTVTGSRLSRSAVGDLFAKHVGSAATNTPSLRHKHPTPHTLRHTCAMELLRAGVDSAVIALWLGHEQVDTTIRTYIHADMSIKERALSRTRPVTAKPGRYRPKDQLLAFLDGL